MRFLRVLLLSLGVSAAATPLPAAASGHDIGNGFIGGPKIRRPVAIPPVIFPVVGYGNHTEDSPTPDEDLWRRAGSICGPAAEPVLESDIVAWEGRTPIGFQGVTADFSCRDLPTGQTDENG